MTIRETAPAGAPCWTDLWTSDVEGARRFYAELLGWEAQAPDPGHGGYFMFTRQGVPVAGGMGPMGDGPEPTNSWTPYFATADIAKTSEGGSSSSAAGCTGAPTTRPSGSWARRATRRGRISACAGPRAEPTRSEEPRFAVHGGAVGSPGGTRGGRDLLCRSRWCWSSGTGPSSRSR